MLVSLYRLTDRLGRAAARASATIGLVLVYGVPGQGWGAVEPRQVATQARPAGAASAASRPRVFQVTLTRRQLPAAGLLLAVNLSLIVAATLLLDRLLHPAGTGVPAAVASAPATLPARNPLAGPVPTAGDSGPRATQPIFATPSSLSLQGTLFYAHRLSGFTNLWAQPLGQLEPVRLTAGPWDDRDPAISPDGTRLAFASHREGSWNLYVLDLATGAVTRLTHGPEFKANPAWSPDGQFLVFEWYRDDNLDIALISAAGGDPIPLTSNRAADYEPSWSPQGREIVWVSMRSGNPDLWWLSLDQPDERAFQPLTATPAVQEAEPAHSPDGVWVAYGDAASPVGLVYRHPARPDASGTPVPEAAVEIGQGLYPAWAPDGTWLATVLALEGGPDRVGAAPLAQPGLTQIAHRVPAGRLKGLAWSPTALPVPLAEPLAQIQALVEAPLWTESLSDPQPPGSDPPYALVPLESVTAADARLSDRVDEAFAGLRTATARSTGWDFLSTLDNALVALAAPPPPSQDYSSWLKTGRAFDVAQAAESYGWVKLTREDSGFRTFWRLWLLAATQDGSLGEPLRRPPWSLAARYSGRPEPYDGGGEYQNALPPGYFVDFTTLAEDYGWARVPAETNWRLFYPGILFWRFEHPAGLDWLAAMREVYTAPEVATQTPVPSPTNTPTVTQTPTRTITPTRTPTRTPTATFTRRPTITPTPTLTRRPTITPTPSRTPVPSPTPTGTWYTQTPTPTLTPLPSSTRIAEP